MLAFGLEWNQGGQGISGNLNTRDAFGKATISGDDFVKLELVDENGSVIADQTIYSCSYTSGLNLVAQVDPVKCHGDSTGGVELVASGGVPPYQFTLDGKTYQTSNTFNQLPAGVYNPAVKDNNGCIKGICTTITQPQPLTLGYQKIDASCFGLADGQIDISTNGGKPPYSYLWSTGDTTEDQPGLSAGTYDLVVTDSNNCLEQTSVLINHPPVLQAALSSF